MIIVSLNRLQKLHILDIFALFFLATIIAACGTPPVTTSSPKQYPSATTNKQQKTPAATAVSSATQLAVSSASPNVNAAKSVDEASSLHIQSDFGFQCSYSTYNVPMNPLVLASDRTTYSQEEIAQIRTYIRDNPRAWKFLSNGTLPPSTLRWVTGGSMNPIPGTFADIPCGARLKLTNKGSTPIQIPQVGVQLEQRPQLNAYVYRLIDVCTILSKSQNTECLPDLGLGGQPDCNDYTASIQLGLGEKNEVFSAIPRGRNGCDTLTINPFDEAILEFDFFLTSNTPKNIIYSIKPILILDTAQGRQTVFLSKMVSTLAFANIKQFSCYGLQGTTFVLKQSPIDPQKSWCL